MVSYMATMVMDMNQNSKLCLSIVCLIAIAPHSLGGELKLNPSLTIEETYTGNVELTNSNKKSSYVSQLTAGIESEYKSRIAYLKLDASSTYAAYSHDHDLDDDYKELDLEGRYYFWSWGPAIVGRAAISNIARNTIDNSLADFVSGNTVESENYAGGLEYNITNSTFTVESSALYTKTQVDDDIGNFEGATAVLKSNNNSQSRAAFWRLNANYTKKKNNGLMAENYKVEAQLGPKFNYAILPYVRFYDEDASGDVSSNITTFSSIGPGIRWRVTSHLFIDASYNYVDDKKLTDDFFSASINWQPSNRTKLVAETSKRFYGDSYNFSFEHNIKRVSNSITYTELVEAFDRFN